MEKNEPAEPSSRKTQAFPLAQIFPKTPRNNWLWKNGFSSIASEIKVRIHSDLEECYFLWDSFSSNDSLFNLWEFRLAWFKGYRYQPFFYTLYFKEKPVALLPLWFNSQDKRYEWFGGTWPEDNYFFAQDKKFIPLLLKLAPKPSYLNAIVGDNLDIEIFKELKSDTPKYIFKLNGIKNIDELLHSLKKKHRHHLRYYYKKFNELNPRIEILDGDQSSRLVDLRELSIIGIERKDESVYRKKERMLTFEKIYKNQGRYKILTFFVFIQNHLVVYDVIALYKNNFYILTGASDIQRFPGIGVYITYVEFKKAIQLGAKMIDCMQEDYHWKHKYFFPQPMWKFEKM